MDLIVYAIVGILAGWFAGIIMKGKGFGIIINLVVGLIGAFVGGYVFKFLGLSVHGLIGTVIMATVGAVVLLVVIGLLRKV
ncbi:MAG: GlsB/YeaQ/YmgE family stress response membrane protein [Thermodesulfobacteriota bacterium]